MVYDVEPQCNFLYRFFTCNLPEGTVDVKVTLCTLKGIHTFRKGHNTQASMCSPWGMQVRPFPSVRRKMKEYIEERQNILNPLVPNKEFHNRPVPSLFTKNPKTTPTKRHHIESRSDIKKPKKGDKRCIQ